MVRKGSAVMVGKCPKCGGELEYDDNDFDCFGNLGYEFKCLDCEATGKEWYTVTYLETVLTEEEI